MQISMRAIVFSGLFLLSSPFLHAQDDRYSMSHEVYTIEDVIALFPKTVERIHQYAQACQNDFKHTVHEIINLPQQEYSFNRVALAYDRAESALYQAISIVYSLQETHPDDQMRVAAHDAVVAIENCIIDTAYHNKELYDVFCLYHATTYQEENLDDEQKYYVKKMVQDFERRGIGLSPEGRQEVEKFHKELAQLSLEFQKNISSDTTRVCVAPEELAGLPDDFIDSQEKNEQGQLVLGVDYPTYFTVLHHGENRKVREKMWQAFDKRAYPANLTVLDEIINKRQQLAELLGYESYAHLEIADEMAETPEQVQIFLDDLIKRSQKKALQEFRDITSNLPESVELTPEGKLCPWDIRFLQESYKKKHFNIDEIKIAEYFPLEHTLNQLLGIYSAFLGVLFEEVELPKGALWHEDVKMLKASAHDDHKTLGFIILDLFPRANKFSHAAEMDIVPALVKEDGTRTIAVASVITNFPKPTEKTPSLLKRDDVITFFHEFGHALHGIFGATKMAFFSGTHVKTDFVETPSQMLEKWMWQPSILKQISKHYQTGEPLSDELIAQLVNMEHGESGFWVLRQCMLAQFSLNLHAGKQMQAPMIYKDIFERLQPFFAFDDNDYLCCSFGHLMWYGSRYYSYLLSKVLASDLFAYIKTHGLFNQEIGKRYVKEILGKGGSVHPKILLKNFLGRDPENSTFFKDLGLHD